MAYVKVGVAHNAIKALRYGENELKHPGAVVGGVDCCGDWHEASRIFKADRIMWNQDKTARGKYKDIQAHIVIQSFKGQECTTEEANKLGQELARRLAPGHRAMVYTHAETENVHNHIVICAVSNENGKKLPSHNLINNARRLSNELTREAGLSVIKRGMGADMRYTQAEAGLMEKGVKPWKQEIREAILESAGLARSEEEFRAALHQRGVEVHERGAKNPQWTYYCEAGRVRGQKLGDDFGREAILRQIERNQEMEQQKALARQAQEAEMARLARQGNQLLEQEKDRRRKQNEAARKAEHERSQSHSRGRGGFGR